MASDLVAVENRLWATADQLWANTGLKPSEFSTPVLGLIFLRYVDKRFADCATILHAKGIPADEREPMDYQAEGVLYMPDAARFSKRTSTEFLWLRLERQPRLGYTTGAAWPPLTQAAINRIALMLSSGHVLRAFDVHVQPLQPRAVLVRASSKLRKTRDLLLPKLISGELGVSTLPEYQPVAA